MELGQPFKAVLSLKTSAICLKIQMLNMRLAPS